MFNIILIVNDSKPLSSISIWVAAPLSQPFRRSYHLYISLFQGIAVTLGNLEGPKHRDDGKATMPALWFLPDEKFVDLLFV